VGEVPLDLIITQCPEFTLGPVQDPLHPMDLDKCIVIYPLLIS
jgi:hypothetical protein